MRLAALAVLLSACSGGRLYGNSDEELSPAYTAKAMCSCLFVMQQTEDFCRAWSTESPAISTMKIDYSGKKVQASAGMFWGARAKYVSAHLGCTLE